MPTQDVGAYTYSSQPHSAPNQRHAKMYKSTEQPADGTPLTIMSDPRVIRGNTHSLARKITKVKTDMTKTKLVTVKDITTHNSSPSYSYQVKSFSNSEIDVSKYLVEQSVDLVQMKNVNNQTDEFSGRPQSAEYIPRKTGVDRSTQVDDVRELFDFDAEVAPILEVIVHKTIEQSLFELSAEHELFSLQQAAEGFHLENDQESEWMRSKEVEVIKESIATKVRIQALEMRKRNETATKSLVAGLMMMQQILPNIVEKTFSVNFSTGVWQEPERIMVSSEILPLLLEDVHNRHAAYLSAQTILDSLMEDAQQQYLTFPHQRAERPVRNVNLHLVFRRLAPLDDVIEVPQQDVDEEGISDVPQLPPQPQDVSIRLLFSIGPIDTAQSMERSILAEIARLKATTTVEEINTDIIPPAPSNEAVIVSQFLSSGTPLNLRSKLTSLMSTYLGAPFREVATDAPLINFPLPDVVLLEFVFSL